MDDFVSLVDLSDEKIRERFNISKLQLEIWEIITGPLINKFGDMRPVSEDWLICSLTSRQIDGEEFLYLQLLKDDSPLEVIIDVENLHKEGLAAELGSGQSDLGAYVSILLGEEVFSAERDSFPESRHFLGDFWRIEVTLFDKSLFPQTQR